MHRPWSALLIALTLLLALVPGASADHDIPWNITPDCDGGFWPTSTGTHTMSGVAKNPNHVIAFWGGGLDGVGGGVWEIVEYNPKGFVKTGTDAAGCITTRTKAANVIRRECANCTEINARRAEIAAQGGSTGSTTTGATATSEEEQPRFIVDSGLDANVEPFGFYVNPGEIGAIAAGSIDDSGVGAVKRYFTTGTHPPVAFNSGRLWVGRSDLVEREVALACPNGCTDLTGMPMTSDLMTFAKQPVDIRKMFLAAHQDDFLEAAKAWSHAHELQLRAEQPAQASQQSQGQMAGHPPVPVTTTDPPKNCVKVPNGQSVYPSWGARTVWGSQQNFRVVPLSPNQQISLGTATLLQTDFNQVGWKPGGQWQYLLPQGAGDVCVVGLGDAPMLVERFDGKLVIKSSDDISQRGPSSADGTAKPPTGSSGVAAFVLVS